MIGGAKSLNLMRLNGRARMVKHSNNEDGARKGARTASLGSPGEKAIPRTPQ